MSQAELAERLDAVVPEGTEAVTGATVAKENSDAVKEDLKIVGILFMIFAGIALFVGSFIIWNTFTMIVTQRSREIALLRAIGATRRQVLRSLLLEAVLLGVAASAIGIGLGLARGQGPQAADGRRRASACRARRCSSSRAPSWSRCWSARSSPSSRRSSRLGGPPRCCRRGAA